MAKLEYKNGITSVILRVKIMDSASTTGGAKTGLTSASSGLIISTIADNEATPTVYTAAGSTTETITTLGTFAAPTATKCRFKEVDSTNHPGLYEIQIANARWAVSNARSLIVTVTVTGGAQVDSEVQLVAVDSQDATRFGLLALPNAAAEAAGGLYTRGTGAGQINQDANGRIDINLKAIIGTVITETVGGYLAAGFKKLLDIAAPVFTLASVVQTGDSFGRIGAAGAGLTALGDTRVANLDAAVSSRSTYAGGAVASVTGAVGSVTGNVGGNVVGNVNGNVVGSVGSASALATDSVNALALAADAVAEIAAAVLSGAGTADQVADHVLRRSTANAEASADGDAVSLKSLLGLISKQQHRFEISPDGTTATVYKSDGVTILGTFTLTSSPGADPISGEVPN